MTTTIDAAGRIVIPKTFRDEMGLSAGTKIEVEMIDGNLRITPKSIGTYEKRGRLTVFVLPPGTPMLQHDVVDQVLNDLREGRLR